MSGCTIFIVVRHPSSHCRKFHYRRCIALYLRSKFTIFNIFESKTKQRVLLITMLLVNLHLRHAKVFNI